MKSRRLHRLHWLMLRLLIKVDAINYWQRMPQFEANQNPSS